MAERLSVPFYDLDVEIERRTGESVPEIFARRGEPWFREREVELTGWLRAQPPGVVSPGGGWVTNPGVVALLRPPGRIMYLDVTPETALRRLGSERAARPLLNRPDPLGELRRLHRERDPLYRLADAVVNTEVLDLQQVIDEVRRLAATSSAA